MEVGGFALALGELERGAQRRTKPPERQAEGRVHGWWGGRRYDGGGRLQGEGVGPVRVLAAGRAEVVARHERGDAGKGFGEAVGIAQPGVEEAVLPHQGARGFEAQFQGGDGGGGLERFEMRVQRAKQDLGIGGGFGQPETARVRRVVLEAQTEFHGGGDELRGAQLERQPVEQPAQQEEQRFERRDGVLELHRGGELQRKRDRVQGTSFAAGGALPEGESDAAKTPHDLVARQGGEIAEGTQAPAVENGGEFSRWVRGGKRERGEEGSFVRDRTNAGQRAGTAAPFSFRGGCIEVEQPVPRLLLEGINEDRIRLRHEKRRGDTPLHLGGVAGEQRGSGDAGGGGETQGGELADGSGGHGFGPRGGALEVDGAHAGRGVLDEGTEGETDGEQCGAGLGLGGGKGRADDEGGAAGDGLGGAHAGLDAGGPGGSRGGEDDGFLARAGKKRRRAVGRSGCGAQHGVQREVGDEENGKHGGREERSEHELPGAAEP